ncbi:PD-(D/E)XK nuclease family transposase [Butyrivibrio fibrisolvens]|uniref:PD-(D/E)XK nuclease family transposase n=1 Tax=Butyrivibrio fibrisolvens TaxID=831 RepID=UPI0003B5A924|nr:PD-(D/E)XK nuclease family transposase [Butyrivibrio fibrisolvens]
MGKKNRGTEISETELSAQINAELEKAIDDLTLFDDDLMSKVFDGNIEAAELLLKIILERDDITVKRVKGQVELKSAYPGGRNIKLDIVAVDNKGVQFDVEVQRNTKGSHIKRARYHQSMMDSRLLKKKQEFKSINDTYVIFICQHDKFKANEPIYHVDKIIRETGEAFDDGAHIIYVNGKYRGQDDFGRLAHDFNCKKADSIYFKPLADGVRHFKETEEGRDVMCESFTKLADKVADERAEQTTINNIKLMMKNMKCSLEEALDALEIKGKDRAIIAKQLQK